MSSAARHPKRASKQWRRCDESDGCVRPPTRSIVGRALGRRAGAWKSRPPLTKRRMLTQDNVVAVAVLFCSVGRGFIAEAATLAAQ